MGGKAFLQLLPNATFPRMPSGVYYALKQVVLGRLHGLFDQVVVPPEAPDKVDYGDLDFLAVQPTVSTVGHTVVQSTINAAACIPMDGNRTSNYAVAFSAFKDTLGRTDGRELASTPDAYFQVDVHVCKDKEELDAVNFMHSYGDMGMILGVIARGIGFQLGTKGLRIDSQLLEKDQPPSFPLSSDFDAIVPFFGLSKERWSQGFQTREQVYDWLLSSPYVKIRDLKDSQRGANQRRDRHMYHAFFKYAHSQRLNSPPAHKDASDATVDEKESQTLIMSKALTFFGRAEEFAAITAQRRHERLCREVFTSTMVREWTGLRGEDWRVMKRLMDLVRAELGGEEGMIALEQCAIKDTTLALRERAVCQVQEEWEQARLSKNTTADENEQ